LNRLQNRIEGAGEDILGCEDEKGLLKGREKKKERAESGAV